MAAGEILCVSQQIWPLNRRIVLGADSVYDVYRLPHGDGGVRDVR